MYLKEDINLLKGDIKTALMQWSESKLNSLCMAHPQLKPMSVYLRRGLTNYIDRIDDKVDSAVDMLLLFVADKDGKIDTDTLELMQWRCSSSPMCISQTSVLSMSLMEQARFC